MDAQHFPPSQPRAVITPTQVIAIGLVVASIGWAMWLLRDRPTREEVELLSGTVLPSSELAIMEAAFDRAQLTDYRSEGGRVWVPRARQSAYMRALVDAEALPREFGGSLRRALEKNSPWQSRAVQAEWLRVATQDELALVICSMPGIERAAVLYDVDEQSAGGGLRGSPVKTASVSVRTQPDVDLDPARVEAIRVLVASSIAGLTPERVAVTDLRNGRVYAGPLDTDRDLAAIDPALARKVAHERHLAAKVRQAVAFLKGSIVDVTVDFDQPAAAPQPAPEPEAVPAAPAQPAAAANAPAEIAVAAPPAASQPALSPSVPVPPADTPAAIRVSIAVPDSVLSAVAQETGARGSAARPDRVVLAAAEQRELERIRQHVLQVLPATPDPAGRQVIITTFPTVPAVRREAGAATDAHLPATLVATGNPVAVTAAAATTHAEPSVQVLASQLLQAIIRRLGGAEGNPRQVWIAATSLSVGLLAAWLWWAGSRSRQPTAPAPMTGHASPPTIDWSRVNATDPPVRHESLDRVAA